jgi:hypothetical protein
MSERPNHVVFIRGLSGRPLFEATTANDSGWHEIADAALTWINKQGL